ncbi:MAG: aldehyde dehydrogenase family protein, partial [Cryomorphaceae bacterium]
MTNKSINPYNGKVVGTYESLTEDQVQSKLNTAEKAFQSWRKVRIEKRAELMMAAAGTLREGANRYAEMITLEMGKPLQEAKSEIEKCAWVCEYYAENGADFLAEEIIETDAQKSFVRHDPIGAVFAVMPWNFPFWQVFRFAAPTLMAGNVGLLKHASNVYGCGEIIEEVFLEAGFPEGVFQNLIVHHDATEEIVKHSAVKAV